MSSSSLDPDHPRPDPSARLRAYGWSDRWATVLTAHPPPLAPARVIEQHRSGYVLATADGELPGRVGGRLLCAPLEAMPAVGDWVAIEPSSPGETAVIAAALPRRSCLSRPASGPKPRLQVLAANIDLVAMVCSLDHDYNLNRLERYLVAMAGSGAELLLVLNKADLHADPAAALVEARALAGATPVLLLSALTGDGMGALRERLRPGQTVAFIGSSGVGKSSLVNALLQESRQAVTAVREHDHGGQHTTTARQLIPHPDGWLLLDTPGVRELRLYAEIAGVDAGFPDIALLSERCRFRDCTHGDEPGCAVAQAVADGEVAPRRLRNYRKMARELAGRERFEERRSRTMQRRLDRWHDAPRQEAAARERRISEQE